MKEEKWVCFSSGDNIWFISKRARLMKVFGGGGR